MSSYYKTYIKPILKNLDADASFELKSDKSAQEYLNKLRNPLLVLKGKGGREVMVNYIYWDIIQFYFRTNIMENTLNSGVQNYKLHIKPGKESEVKTAIKCASQIPLKPIDERLKYLKFVTENAKLEKTKVR